MGYRILLIDHGSGAAARLGESLARAGHETIGASGVVEALMVVGQQSPDVVLIDDGGAEEAIAALCSRLSNESRKRPSAVILLADHVSRVVADPAERAKRIGCDRVVDSAIATTELLTLLAEMLPADAARSEWIEVTNRDALSAESFRASIEAPLMMDAPAVAEADEGGRDIEAHLDSLFAAARPARAPAKAPAPPVLGNAPAPAAATDPALPLVEPPRRPTAPRVDAPARQARTAAPPATAAAPAARPATTAARPPEQAARPAPVAAAVGHAPTAAPSSTGTRPAAHGADHGAGASLVPPPREQPTAEPLPAPPKDTVRKPPKALEQLRAPRIAQTPVGEPQRRWPVPPGAVAAAAIVLVAAAAIAGFMWLRPTAGAEVPPPTPEPQAAARVEPEPAQPAPEPPTVAQELPAPPTLEEQPNPIDFAAPTIPVAPVVAPAAEERPDALVVASAAPSKPPAPAASKPSAPKPDVKPAPVKPPSMQAAGETKTADRPAETSTPGAAGASKTASPAAQVPPPAPTPVPAPAAAEKAAPAVAAAPPATEPSEPATASTEASPAAPTPAPQPVTVPPEVIERVEPTYSAAALKKVDDATIVLRILVDEQGRIARVVVDKGIPGSELEAAAISAVLRWRFRPGTGGGVPVAAWTSARFHFKR